MNRSASFTAMKRGVTTLYDIQRSGEGTLISLPSLRHVQQLLDAVGAGRAAAAGHPNL
jgi:hypothetical protein